MTNTRNALNDNLIASIMIVQLSWTLPRLIFPIQPTPPIQIAIGILFNIIIWSMVIDKIRKCL